MKLRRTGLDDDHGPTYSAVPTARLFFDADGEAIPPLVMGGSAGLNSAMFFACPACGAVVMDVHHSVKNRAIHEDFHVIIADAEPSAS